MIFDLALKESVQSRRTYFFLIPYRLFARLVLFGCIITSFLIFNSSCTQPKQVSRSQSKNLPATSEVSSADTYMAQGLNFYQRGDFEQALLNWTESVRLYEQAGNLSKQCEAFIRLSQTYQSVGQYQKAIETLETALVLANSIDDRAKVASVLSTVGNIYVVIGPADKAYEYLNQGLALARKLNDPGLSAVILNNLGNLLASQKKSKEAMPAYQEAVTLANKSGNRSLAAVALTNTAAASLQAGLYQKSMILLDQAFNLTQDLPHSHAKAYGLIKIGLAFKGLNPHLPRAEYRLTKSAFKSLSEAATVAETIGDYRSMSYAWGYLGKLYEDVQQHQEALQCTRWASFAAQKANSPESLYQWQWQTGRILKTQAKVDEAVAAYRRAVDTLQSIREEISVTYESKQLSFRDSIGHLYFELVDLLLQRAASLEEREQVEEYLLEAREKIELLKVAELRDYFQDECVAAIQARKISLDVVSQSAAIIYPILFKDRIELLVSLPGGLKRFSSPVGLDVVTQEIRMFRKMLEKRISREYLAHAKKLYEWLIKPMEGDLQTLSVKTLVFVPDGALLTVPMAALYDGQDFLISKFALAITPGLNLTDPRPIKREGIKILTVGLTEASQGFPPLPYVASELKAIQNLYGGRELLNQDFLFSSFQKALLEEPFNIIHIASHGQFESDVQKTFLLTFDSRLTLDQLDRCVGLFRFREEPLELLTLSACETAAGDDRAALGLAGVAVKAGARSALATLWYINDRASSILISEFYRQLHDPSVSRAVAIRRAQLKLLKDPRYEHPGYWAPFILINNWL